jgi:hypothetical protein
VPVILTALLVAFCGVTARLFIFPTTGMSAQVGAIVVPGGPGSRIDAGRGWRNGRCYGGASYAVTTPLPLHLRAFQIAYQWAATAKAERVNRAC